MTTMNTIATSTTAAITITMHPTVMNLIVSSITAIYTIAKKILAKRIVAMVLGRIILNVIVTSYRTIVVQLRGKVLTG
jgi:hypothetical protein